MDDRRLGRVVVHYEAKEWEGLDRKDCLQVYFMYDQTHRRESTV